MPVQPSIFGRAIPLPDRLPPRRFTALLGFTIFFAVWIILSFATSSAPSLEQVKKIPQQLHEHLPTSGFASFRSPFGRPVPGANGESTWLSNWNWLNPFSSSVTLDENRSVLPPSKIRPLIYTFHDADAKKDEAVRAAEKDLLLVWRRAWWAQGFKPIVLGMPEAINNPLYQRVQSQQLEPVVQANLFRWLAWEAVGGGILANWLALPMPSSDSPLLSYLQRADYPVLSRYDGMGTALFVGNKVEVTAALTKLLDHPDLAKSKSFLDLFTADDFSVDRDAAAAIAIYDIPTLNSKYKLVYDKLTASEADGLRALAQLINSHLHTTFQNSFPQGIAVVNPIPEHTSALVQPAVQIASYLAECTESPMPSSCPPNRPKCTPCVSSNPLPIETPQVFRNTSTLYTIGTVPHPYTLVTLTSPRQTLDVVYIRRQTSRDPWLVAATKELLGTAVGTVPRLIKFKEAVASDYGRAHSLWLVPEMDLPEELDWHFGFAIPKSAMDRGYSNSPVPGSSPNKPRVSTDGLKTPTAPELEEGKVLLQKAKEALESRHRSQQRTRAMVEAWNLADTEAWKFARAFAARARHERAKWVEDEKKFGVGGGEGGRPSGWGKWFDPFRSGGDST